MAEFPIVRTQRFWEIRLNELLDYDSYQVERFVDGCKDARELADKVIQEIEYPFYHGQPDDLHIWNAFHGKYCRRVDADFWQKASETAAMKIGDCEDSSILGVAGSLLLGKEAYEVFGYVEDIRTGEILGGHGWYYVKDPDGFGDDKFHYIESTLDRPPEKYPVVEDIRKPFVSGVWRLVPEVIWNKKTYEPLGLTIDMASRVARLMAKVKSDAILRAGYFYLTKKMKETRRKYEALARMWNIPTKPLRRAGILSRLRWRK